MKKIHITLWCKFYFSIFFHSYLLHCVTHSFHSIIYIYIWLNQNRNCKRKKKNKGKKKEGLSPSLPYYAFSQILDSISFSHLGCLHLVSFFLPLNASLFHRPLFTCATFIGFGVGVVELHPCSKFDAFCNFGLWVDPLLIDWWWKDRVFMDSIMLQVSLSWCVRLPSFPETCPKT